MPIDLSQVQWDAAPTIDPRAVKWDNTPSIANQIANDAISQGAREFPAQGSDAIGGVSQAVLNALGGFVRGAGSIGATIARPFESGAENDQRRAGIDANMQAVGAQPDSIFYKGGKLGGEVAGTAGIGGVAANGLRAAARVSPALLPYMTPLAAAVETGGFRTGGLSGIPNVLTRVAGGAINGGLTAGAVNPEDAALGAAIGGAMPATTQLLGAAGDAAGKVFQKNTPTPNQRTIDTAREAIAAGYVVPPNMVEPGFKNQVIESISGKQATEQVASNKNTAITEGVVRDALGIAPDVQLTQSTLEGLRKTAGKAYADVANISPQAASDLEALKTARNEAQGWFKAYNRSASPNDLATAKQFRAAADNYENLLEFQALQAGRPDLVPALQDARKQIAKTYTVGRTLNDASGTVDARILGRMYEKGLPLSDGLDVAGKFASAFPAINKSPQQVGSVGVHNLKAGAAWLAGMLGGGAGYMGAGLAGAGGLGLGAAALPFIAPPLARSYMFSQGTQRGLLPMLSHTADPLGLLTQSAYRVGPLLAAQ